MSPETRRARIATSVVFAVHGTVVGSFAARIPWIAGHVGLDVGKLGVALVMPGVGAMVAMPFSGRLAHRHGLRALVAVTIACYAFTLVLPALATSLALLCVALAVAGAGAGLADMAMNAEGSIVESRYGTSIMSSLHGFWSVGVLIGGGVSALAAHQALDTRVQFLLEAIVLAAIGVVASRALIDEEPVEEVEAPPMFSLPPREVIAIGLIGLFAVFGEIGGTDWSALYLKRELGASPGVAALAVSALAFAMALTRLLGDHAIRRLGPVATVRAAGVCAFAGALCVTLAHGLAAGLVGFALLGVGVAVVVPLVFAAAGRVGTSPARSIAGVAGISYATGLVAPGAIGGIASASSLRASFGVIAILVAAMALGAGALRRS